MADTHNFEITQNNAGVILATAGKYCTKDISVMAHIDETQIRQEGFAEGSQSGRDAAWNEFWDTFQEGGNRTDYEKAFRGAWWNGVTYKPKYVPRPVNAGYMYQYSEVEGRVEIDTSACTNMDALFSVSKKITSIGTIDTRNINRIAGVFGYMSNLQNIDLLILKEDGSQTFTVTCFEGDPYLKEIRIQGKIGNSLDMKQCYRFSKESITSIINALSDDVSGQTLVLSEFVKKYLTEEEWTALTGTKQNWTISFTIG